VRRLHLRLEARDAENMESPHVVFYNISACRFRTGFGFGARRRRINNQVQKSRTRTRTRTRTRFIGNQFENSVSTVKSGVDNLLQ